jgi:TRAP transporter TAXI family solute receptor
MSLTQVARLYSAILTFCMMSVLIGAAHSAPWEKTRDKINANTVTILSGNPNGTYLFIASDIAFALDEGDEMRVLPIVGKGGAQNVRDLIYLRNIDMAIVRSDAFQTYNGERIYGSLNSQLRYIARLYNEEMHVLARKDITSIDQLNGATVNLSDAGSGTQLTSQLVFHRLGIAINEVNMSQRDGFAALKAGEIDATILVAGKPSRSWQSLKIDTGKFHLLPVPWPESLEDFYLPTTIGHADYPNLVAEGEQVETIAAGAILAAYDWKPDSVRYNRVAGFVDRFFTRIVEGAFRKRARHPKWREVNIAAELPNWQRFEAAEQWLGRNQVAASGEQKLQQEFSAFLTANGGLDRPVTEAEKNAVFRRFMEWRNANPKLTASN